jgi:hypothetical protein
MTDTITVKSKIGVDDLALAEGGSGAPETFGRRTSTGGALNQEKLDASHLKFRATSGAVEDLLSGTLDLSAGTLTANDIKAKAPIVDARAYGAAGLRATIDAALTAIGADSKTLYLAPGTWVGVAAAGSNLTVPANVNLWMDMGAILTIANGKTLTINGPLEAGLYQVFDWSGSGTVAGLAQVQAVLPEWFGAKGDGSTDDYASVAKTLAVAEACTRPVHFRPRTTYKINTKLAAVDVSNTQLVGDASVLDFTGLSAAGVDHYALQIYCSSSYETRWRNLKPAIQGLHLIGAYTSGAVKDHTGIFIGHNTYTETAMISLDHVVIQGFTVNVRFGDNSWRIAFNDCYIKWGKIWAPSGLTNHGENISFQNCMLADTGGLGLDLAIDGFFHFLHTSFDNYHIKVAGDATANLVSCHLENPGNTDTDYYWVNVDSGSGFVQLTDCVMVLNNPGANYTNAFFRVHNDNLYRGMHISNLWISSQSSWYTPEVNSVNRVLVEGNGRVMVDNLAFHFNYYWFNVAYWLGRLNNHSFETGNLNGWTEDTGGGGTVTVVDTDKKVGTYSLRLQAGAGQNCRVYQEFPVSEVGKHVAVTLWVKRSFGTGGNITRTFAFYDQTGNEISGYDVGWGQDTSNEDWHLQTFGAPRIPPGTAKIRLDFYLTGGSGGTSTVYLDDVLVNVY